MTESERSRLERSGLSSRPEESVSTTPSALRPLRLLRQACDAADTGFVALARKLGDVVRVWDPGNLVTEVPTHAVGVRSPAAQLATSAAPAHPNPLGTTDPSTLGECLAAQLEVAMRGPREGSTATDAAHEIALAVERCVARFLECDGVSFELDDGVYSASPKRTGVEVPSGALLLQARVTFCSQHLATLRAWRVPGVAPFVERDFDLLRTVGSQAALALALARASAELSEGRRMRIGAWHGEREALLMTIAAEIADEVRCPVNFFRSVFRDASAGQVLDAEEVEIGAEEVDRLERLAAELRRMANRKLDRSVVPVHELVQRALTTLTDELSGTRVIVSVGQDRVKCNADLLSLVLVHIVLNASDAVAGSGTIGVSWTVAQDGARLVVWDTGLGLKGDPAMVFRPWFTTKPSGGGMGLTIAHRILRSHGWSIDVARRDDKTLFTVTVPPSDVVRADVARESLPSNERPVPEIQ